jgi:hypothetical protein
MSRCITPPPALYLLTPPPTGGSDIRDGFLDTDLASTNSRRQSKFKEGESPDAFFEEPQDGSNVELSESEESVSMTDDPSSASRTSDTSIAAEINIIRKHGFSSVLATSSDEPPVTNPFPLLKLPLSVRNRVYAHLLVVPGLICICQKQTASHDGDKVYLHAEPRQLLPGIAHGLVQLTVDGYKIHFSRFASTNINILRASKEVHAEAKSVLYGKNDFDIVKPSTEMAPQPDFSVRLFPSGCQRLVPKLNIRIRSFYDLHWLLDTGYNVIKNFYRGLRTLTLILELESAKKGFGRQWAKKEGEKWHIYVKRLQVDIAKDAFAASKGKKVKTVPTWNNLHVLFSGESYDEKLNSVSTAVSHRGQQARHDELRHALEEAWELFKKGGR